MQQCIKHKKVTLWAWSTWHHSRCDEPAMALCYALLCCAAVQNASFCNLTFKKAPDTLQHPSWLAMAWMLLFLCVSMYIYIYISVCIYVCIYIYSMCVCHTLSRRVFLLSAGASGSIQLPDATKLWCIEGRVD